MEQRRPKKRVRIVLIGDFGVGKSSLLRQFLDRKFLVAPSQTVQEDEVSKTSKTRLQVIDWPSRVDRILITRCTERGKRHSWLRAG